MNGLLAAANEVTRVDWTSNTMIFIYIVAALVIGLVITLLLTRRTVRTRLATEKKIREDPDINEWLVIFSWSNKVLYLPVMAASIAAAVLVFLKAHVPVLEPLQPTWVGGVWFGVFLVNFMVEEYEINIKVAIIGALFLGFLFLMLHLIGKVVPFLRLFTHIKISLSGSTYAVVAALGVVTVLISWFRGLFYYVALTPNYMNVQWGPTESGDQIGRDAYSTTVNTDDFLERAFGFGKIMVTFLDQRRPPIVLLVWRIGRKVAALERIRGTMSIDTDGRRHVHPVS